MVRFWRECIDFSILYLSLFVQKSHSSLRTGTGQFPTTRVLEHGGKEFVPYYLLGFGNGACTALYYSIHMHDASMRALLMINGFSYVDERLASVLHDCVNVFSLCPKTRPDLPVYFYSRFLFSKKFLSKVSSAMALNMYTAVRIKKRRVRERERERESECVCVSILTHF